MKTKNIAMLIENQEQANKLAHWLAYRGITFRVGDTIAMRRPVIVARLDKKERALIRIFVGEFKTLQRFKYYLVKEIA